MKNIGIATGVGGASVPQRARMQKFLGLNLGVKL